MQSTIAKRSIVIGDHKTSVSLEDAFWQGLREIARRRHMTLGELVDNIDANRTQGNLSSAIRVFVLGHYQDQIAPQHAQHEPKENGAVVALTA
jgi:predicted DNA-binding ribbon-helix-helix protein